MPSKHRKKKRKPRCAVPKKRHGLRRRRSRRCLPHKHKRHVARPAPKPAPKKRLIRRPKPHPTPPPPLPNDAIVRPSHLAGSPIATYNGSFGQAEAERLLWRAGFGPSPGWVDSLAAKGVAGAVDALIDPQGAETFTGAEPVDSSGNPLAPEDAYGHDHLFWLDRMVRTDQPFVQRMALIWHDWFATSNSSVDSQKLMLTQYELFRQHGRGSFEDLVSGVTQDGAMILWLNANQNRKGAINENYARELMELFTLGADRGAYTETDVRELGRCLSGWRGDYSSELGWTNFRFDSTRWDSGRKTVFGKSGAYKWDDAYRLCLYHSLHPSFFVKKLWSYFVPTTPSDSEVASLSAAYVNGGFQVLPVVRAILMHPSLYNGPRMVKPPAVFAAGLLRALRRPVDRSEWYSYGEQAGQRLFYPPDVSGWDDSRWLDTSTLRGRWLLVQLALGDRYIASSAAYDSAETPDAALSSALTFWANPRLTGESLASLGSFSASCLPAVMTTTQQRTYRIYRQNALRQLIASVPDNQTS